MNKDILKGHWREVRGQVKQQWGKLTDNDLAQINGSFDMLEGKLQKAYGYQKEQAHREIETFLKDNGFEE